MRTSMRIVKLAILIVGACVVGRVRAQSISFYPPVASGSGIPTGTSLPATCTVGAVFSLTGGSSPGLYQCTATNTWTLPPAGSAAASAVSYTAPNTGGATNLQTLLTNLGANGYTGAPSTDFLLGPGTGNNTLTGTYDTAVGIDAGASLTVPGSSANPQADTFFGYGAGQNATTARETTCIGYLACNSLTGSGDGIEDGTSTAIGSFALASWGGTQGNPGDNVAIGQKSLTNLTDASVASNDNTAVGTHCASAWLNGGQNIFIGQSVANLGGAPTATGSGNTIVGQGALFNASGVNQKNTAIGQYTLYSQTAGTENTVGGYDSGYSITTAGDVTAWGPESLYTCSTCARNTAIGHHALYTSNGNDNTAVGDFAAPVATGNSETAVGSIALNTVSSGNGNTGVGYDACGTVTTGSNNTCYGNDAETANANDNNSIVIGYGATGATSTTTAPTAVIGNYGTTDLYGGYASSGGAVSTTFHSGAHYVGGPLNFPGTGTPSAPTAGTPTSGGSCTAGAHLFKITFLNAAGESPASAASGSVTCVASTGQTVPLSKIPLGPLGTTGRNIYATQQGGSTYYLVSTSPVLSNNTATTYSFAIADGSLTGTTAPSTDTTAYAAIQVAGTTALSIAKSTYEITQSGVAYASLGTPSNGTQAYCSNCDPPVTEGAACSSSGTQTGAMAWYVRGGWICF